MSLGSDNSLRKYPWVVISNNFASLDHEYFRLGVIVSSPLIEAAVWNKPHTTHKSANMAGTQILFIRIKSWILKNFVYYEIFVFLIFFYYLKM